MPLFVILKVSLPKMAGFESPQYVAGWIDGLIIRIICGWVRISSIMKWDQLWGPLTLFCQWEFPLFWHFSRFPRRVFPFFCLSSGLSLLHFYQEDFFFQFWSFFTNRLTAKPLKTLSIKILKQICDRTLKIIAC